MAQENNLTKSFEYIVIGTGPGGGTVARELSKAKKNVLMVEKGAYHKKGLGFPFGARILRGLDPFSKSLEGVIVGRGITVGGSSVVYNANVFDPPRFLYEKMGIDFQQEADELKEEIDIFEMPDRFFAHASGGNRVREAADKLGIKFEIQKKFIDPDKCRVGCDWCMLGCKYNAKWTTRKYVDEAVENGATLLVSSPVEKIIFENNRAKGIKLKNGRMISGEKIIVAAGGLGTANILIRSGMKNVGKNFFMDPMHVVTGYADDVNSGAWKELTFSHATEDFEESDGFIIGNVSSTYTSFLPMARFNIFRKNIFKALPLIKRGIGLFVKLADNPNGEIFENGKYSKPFDEDDKKRMNKGVEISREILIKAGIKPSTITVAEWIGGHPGGTAAMGKIVDKNFQTEYENLFVCDASVLPVSPGAPPSFSILAFAKLFSKMLLQKVSVEDREVKANA